MVNKLNFDYLKEGLMHIHNLFINDNKHNIYMK